MKLEEKNKIREEYLQQIMNLYFNEDIGKITSNSFNMPMCTEDGEEFWIEFVVKIPKDTGDDGYLKREEYQIKLENKRQKQLEKQRKLERKGK